MKNKNGNYKKLCILYEKITNNLKLENLINLMIDELTHEYSVKNIILMFAVDNKKNLRNVKNHLEKLYKAMEEIGIGNKISVNELSPYSECFKKMKKIDITKETYNQWDNYTKMIFKARDVKHAVVLPVKNETECIGTITIYDRENKIDKETVKDVEKIIKIFFNPFKTSLIMSDLSSKEKEVLKLYLKNIEVLHIAERINNLTNLKSIYVNILQEFINIYDFNFASILIEKNNYLEPQAFVSTEDKLSKKVSAKVKDFLKNSGYYRTDAPDGATSAAFNLNNHYFFKDVQEIINLQMSEKDKGYLDATISPRSLFVVPVLSRKKVIGIVHLISLHDTIDLSERDKETIQTLCSFIGTAIENSKLYSLVEEQKESLEKAKEEIETQNNKLLSDLEIARRIQESIIQIVGDTHELDISSKYIAMESLGGDMFDVRRIGKKSYSLMIADVSGHGVPAALITTMVKTSFINRSSIGKEPHEICKEVNDDLYSLIGDTNHYLTAFYAIIDLEAMKLKFTNCGHVTSLLYRPEKKEANVLELYSTGNFIGIFDNPDFATTSVDLKVNDKVLLYTDGVIEARNSNKNMFSYDRLLKLFNKIGDHKPSKILDEIVKEVDKFCGEKALADDLACVIVEILSD